jgi:hypothetical protein
MRAMNRFRFCSVLGGIFVGTLSVAVAQELKPETLPTFSSLQLYSADSPFNQPIAMDAEVDPDSAAYIERLQDAAPLLINLKQYTVPVYFADSTTPKYDVKLPCGTYWEIGVKKLLGVPIPDWAEPGLDSSGTIKPRGCGEDSDQDNNMVILDLEARCEYDFWQARYIESKGKWKASWGNAISMDSNGVYPAGVSTRGSGLAILGGVIWPDELQNGEITHALVFAYPFTRSGGPVAPATDSDGESKGARALPEGARLRLDPDLDLDTLELTAAERTIARALQVYGMYLADNGGESGIGIYAVDPRSASVNPYTGVLPDKTFPKLKGIPLASLQVLKLPAQDSDWRDTLNIVDTGCNNFLYE